MFRLRMFGRFQGFASRGWLTPVALSITLLSAAVGGPARAEDVDVALALVSDVSGSIGDDEYKLEKEGYGRALENRQFLDAIQHGPLGKVAIAYIEFSSERDTRTVLNWTVISDASSARAFAQLLILSPRSSSGLTAIGSGVEQGLKLLAEPGLNATHRVIDVCGDGTNNDGPDISLERDKAVRAGIVINGLAINNDTSLYAHVQPYGGLVKYYRDNVVGGPNSFVMEVRGFTTISDAMIRKLIVEIAAEPHGNGFGASRPAASSKATLRLGSR